MSYKALYREWRPQFFKDVVGQEHITTTLINQIKTGRIAHAYLFCGSRGTGKTTTAKIFARAVNCETPVNGEPCGVCSTCRKINDENVMDIIEIDAASNRGVDEARDLREKVKFPPSIGKYKVYIIDEVHMLTMEAFNTLLKTLEEPPSHVVFILATTEPQRLPETILSRCQRYDFHRISKDNIVKRLQSIANEVNANFDDESLSLIARDSEGGMRDALSLMDQCISYCGQEVHIDDVVNILGTTDSHFLFKIADDLINSDVKSTLHMVDELIGAGKDISSFVKDLIVHFRNLLFLNISSDCTDLLEVSKETAALYQKQGSKANRDRLIRTIDILTGLQNELKWSAQPRILFELSLIKIARPECDSSYESLMERVQKLEDIIKNGEINIKNDTVAEADERSVYQSKKSTEDVSQNIVKNEKPKETIKNTNVSLSNDKIWDSFIKQIKNDKAMYVYTLIIDGKFEGIDSGRFNISFPAGKEIYITALQSEKYKHYMEDTVKKITGQDLMVQFIKEGTKQKEIKKNNDAVSTAIDIFGKDNVEVVEDKKNE